MLVLATTFHAANNSPVCLVEPTGGPGCDGLCRFQKVIRFDRYANCRRKKLVRTIIEKCIVDRNVLLHQMVHRTTDAFNGRNWTFSCLRTAKPSEKLLGNSTDQILLCVSWLLCSLQTLPITTYNRLEAKEMHPVAFLQNRGVPKVYAW